MMIILARSELHVQKVLQIMNRMLNVTDNNSFSKLNSYFWTYLKLNISIKPVSSSNKKG